MGQEILYCFKCQTRLLGSEFEKGKAFKVGGKASCAICVKELLDAVPSVGTESERGRKVSSTARLQAVVPDSSSKFKPIRPPQPTPGPSSAPPKSNGPMIMGLVIGGVVLLILIAMAATSGRTPTPARHDPAPPTPAPPPGGRNEDPRPRPPPEASFAAELREIDEKIRTGLAKEEFRSIQELLASARTRRPAAEWLTEIDLRIPQVEARARRAAQAIREKAVEARKRKDDAGVKRFRDQIASWNFPGLVDEFDKALAASDAPPPPPPPPPPVSGSTEAPLVVYADELAPGWQNLSWSGDLNLAATSPVFEGARSVAFTPQVKAAGIYFGSNHGVDASQYPLVTFALYIAEDQVGVGVALYNEWKPATPVNLLKLGGLPPPREWKRYVLPVKDINPDSTKITSFIVQVFKTGTQPLVYLDSVAFLKGAAPVKAPATSELDGYRTRWSRAAAKAASRDYPGAQKEIEEAAASLKDDAAKAEAAADLELLKLAAQVPVVLDKGTKGAKVRLDFLNAGGERETVEGTLLSGDAVRLSVQRDGGILDLPTAELLPSTFAEQFRARADKKPTDARAAAAFCLFEGDAEAGRALWGEGAPIPEKLLGLAKAKSDAEVAARQTFWTAESEFVSPKRRSSAVEKYTAFLADSSPLAARLKPYVAARLEAARDTVFLAEDLSAAGTFVSTPSTKIEACWMSSADGQPGKTKENYVEAEFHAFPGAAYRAWIWAGACCQETFECLLQATELTGPNAKPCEPGGDAALTAKLPPIALRKWHAQHGGPKEPAKWDWIPVALPKYEAGGPKKLRVLTAQQGFTVGAIVVSASRRDTPREAEIKDLEKLRYGNRKSTVSPGPQGLILAEWWSNIEGNLVENLTKHPSFAGKPSGSRYLDVFEANRDVADNYGRRIRGYVHPPVTGAYTFWISSDDEGELHLSTDDTPIRKRKIAGNPPASGFRDWTKTASQKSAPIVLTAGRRYYIEALHKEGSGEDHLSVGWTLPDGTDERPIPGTRLSPWSATPPLAGPAGTVFFRGYNINGDPTIIDGRRWEGKKAPTLAFSSEPALDNQNVPLNPPTDDARAAMIRSSAFAPGGTMVKVYQIPAGTYQVSLYVWEDNDNQVFDLFLNGREVKKAHNSGATGHWDKLGPWPVAVTEGGIIEVRSAGGDANLSGLEIWKVQKP